MVLLHCTRTRKKTRSERGAQAAYCTYCTLLITEGWKNEMKNKTNQFHSTLTLYDLRATGKVDVLITDGTIWSILILLAYIMYHGVLKQQQQLLRACECFAKRTVIILYSQRVHVRDIYPSVHPLNIMYVTCFEILGSGRARSISVKIFVYLVNLLKYARALL